MLTNLYLVNYCHPNCKPLENIMRLPEAEAFALAARLAAENPDTTAFYRFADFGNYYPRRMETDRRLRERFLRLGGRPVQTHPLSFVLGESDYLMDWFGHGAVTKIPLAGVPADCISFTLGDSMSTLDRDGDFTMLTLDMLRGEMAAHPRGRDGYLREMQARHHYIEVQLWDDTPCVLSEAARRLSLGELTAPPVRLNGGFTHRMFRLTTAQGDFAVKLLNPEIMARPDVLDNYRAAEAGEALLEAAGLPILPAKAIGGRKMQCVNGQHLYVFDYFDGRALEEGEITTAHCAKIGAVLARIHGIDRREKSVQADGSSAQETTQSADNSPVTGNLWHALAADLLSSADAQEEGELLLSAAPMLTRATAAAEDGARRLPPVEALCHNDMDPKNVLWRGQEFRIIDLECLGYAHPQQELLDLALSWSGGSEECFKAFVSAYAQAGGEPMADAAIVYDSRRNYLDWPSYNARRALAADAQERATARAQIRWTAGKIQRDLDLRERVLAWMGE